MPNNEQANVLTAKFQHHIKQAETYKTQKAYDSAIAEYLEAMKQLKAVWLENQFRTKNILNMFQPDNFDDQNVTAIKLGIAECYLANDDLEKAYIILTQVNRVYIKDTAVFNDQLSALEQKIRHKAKLLFESGEKLLTMIGDPVKAPTEHVAWIEQRSRMAIEARRLLAGNPVAADANKAFSLMRAYKDNSKYLNPTERGLYNQLADAYDRFDAGRHPMIPVHKL